MVNPGGDYPGRQIVTGYLKDGVPAFVYLVTGRSKASQERQAVLDESCNSVRIKPLDLNEPFDRFRHYEAVQTSKDGYLIVSNNQAVVDPVFEALQCNGKYLGRVSRIVDAIGPEYDNKEKPTPRILGIFSPGDPEHNVWRILSRSQKEIRISGPICDAGTFQFVQTYDGKIEYDVMNNKFDIPFPVFESNNPSDLANELYEMTDYIDGKYGDLRVCTVAGIKKGNGFGGWELAVKNRIQGI